jgi:hypothetical protein
MTTRVKNERLTGQSFMVKCTYSNNVSAGNTLVLSSLDNALPGSVRADLPPLSLGVEEQVSTQVLRLLDAISRKSWPTDVFISTYFATFNRCLPILNRDIFTSQLQNPEPSSDFSALLLAMILISHLSSKIASGDQRKTKEELYPTLKSIYSLLLSTGKVSVELVQAGVIIAAYEHCQALHRDAWLGIGNCARLGQVLGLNHVIREPMPGEVGERGMFEMERCLWWGIVVLER